MSDDKSKVAKRAVLLAVQLPDTSDEEHRAARIELERLAKTLGIQVVAHLSQKRRAIEGGTVVGQGKLRELAALTGGPGLDHKDEDDEEDGTDPEVHLSERAELVICDLEISPTQLQNLEKATGVEVLDRTGLILEIFNRHARSREARLQIELAKLKYMAPRLRASPVGGDRQGGGIGAKGAGETAHELDSRRIRDRISELRHQLEIIHQEQKQRRAQRSEMNCVALVGYTNAGKSSLMRALTGSEVLVEDKLFATLDTTIRSLQPDVMPRILVSDTVGFINKLPHDLVASFRSTLDEALAAGLLLLTVDASDPNFRSQLATTQEVLQEIGAESIPRQLVLNKMDSVSSAEGAELLKEFPSALAISTRNGGDVERVRQLLRDFFEKDMQEETFLIPYARSHLIGELRARARVLAETHEDEGTHFCVRASRETLAWLRRYIETPR